MDAMKRLGIAPGGVFGLGDGVAEVAAGVLAASVAQQQQQQQQNSNNDSSKNSMSSLGQASAYQFLKADSLYSAAMPQIDQSSMSRNQFYPFSMNSSHLQQQQSAADSVFESLQQHNQISNMMNHPSMSQLTSTMGSVAQQLHFADHMSHMMSYQTHPSAYANSGQMYAGTSALSSLGQSWPSHQGASTVNPFMLGNSRSTFGSATDGASVSSQQMGNSSSSANHARGSHHGASSSHQHSGTHHHQASTSQQSASTSTGMSGLPLTTITSLTQLGMQAGVGAATPDCDPRELEAFAERFKQRRIKLGVTQADVGVALGKLQIPGVGPLSQSTICRFESLTLSHNNMIALKPILEAWLDRAEKEMRERKENAADAGGSGKKRKRTSIPAPEKRSLEAYFQLQPRPSGEKIAQIADKLDLKKNVVRVWFCNQRQKQKRMKFAQGGAGGAVSAPSSASVSSRSSQN